MLNLKIRTRKELIFYGEVSFFTSFNSFGKFDILPDHEQYISLIKNTISFIDSNGKKSEYKLSSGLIRVVNNQISAFIEI